MSFRVKFLESAESDMDCIEEYLSQYYPSTARNFFEQMKEKALLLEDNPYLCPAYEDDPFFRRAVINDYLMFYSVDEKRNYVIIHRIIHSKRNISTEILENQVSEENV